MKIFQFLMVPPVRLHKLKIGAIGEFCDVCWLRHAAEVADALNWRYESNYFDIARAAAKAAGNLCDVLGICICTSDEFFVFRIRLGTVV